MGLVFGKIDVEVPKHVVVKEANGFQIWKYPPCIAARVRAVDINPDNPPSGKEFSNQAFRLLARYIGVFNEPENTARAPSASTPAGEKVAMTGPVVMTTPAPEAVAMTAPVVMSTPAPEAVAMTAPVVMTPPAGEQTEPVAMTAPVHMSTADGQKTAGETMAFLLPAKYASVEQAPVPTNEAVKLERMPERFEAVLAFSGFLPQDDSQAAQQRGDELLALMKGEEIEATGRFFLAGYNPPFTLPWLRRNEVHIPVDGDGFQE